MGNWIIIMMHWLKDEVQKKKILKALRQSKLPYLNVQQIADESGIFRHTVSKYITILVK